MRQGVFLSFFLHLPSFLKERSKELLLRALPFGEQAALSRGFCFSAEREFSSVLRKKAKGFYFPPSFGGTGSSLPRFLLFCGTGSFLPFHGKKQRAFTSRPPFGGTGSSLPRFLLFCSTLLFPSNWQQKRARCKLSTVYNAPLEMGHSLLLCPRFPLRSAAPAGSRKVPFPRGREYTPGPLRSP